MQYAAQLEAERYSVCHACYRFHTVTAGRGRGKKLMLLVHGFPELWYSWRWQLEAFKDGYEVVAFDLRGYGQTEKPKVMLCIHLNPAAKPLHCSLLLCLTILKVGHMRYYWLHRGETKLAQL